MAVLIIALSLIFLGIGLGVNAGNARYLLAGYNTMSEAERQKVDIAGYIPVFRRFHIVFSLSFLVLGLLVYYLFGEDGGVIFLTLYPIAAYGYLWKIGKQYDVNPSNTRNAKILPLIFIITAGLVLALYLAGTRESVLLVQQDGIKITGVYGQTIPYADIQQAEVVETLPSDRVKKVQGYAVGAIRKGIFKSSSTGEKFKLILNVRNSPYLRIDLTDGKVIYFNSENFAEQHYLDRMIAASGRTEWQ